MLLACPTGVPQPQHAAHSNPCLQHNCTLGIHVLFLLPCHAAGSEVGVVPTPKMALEAVVRVAREDVRFVRKIGEGAFGEVSQATVFPYGTVAIKWLKASGALAAPARHAVALHPCSTADPAFAACCRHKQPRHSTPAWHVAQGGWHGCCTLASCHLSHHAAQKDRFAKYSESFMREAEVLATLNHPNIIRMYGLVTERDAAGGGGDGMSPSEAGGRTAPATAGPSGPGHSQASGPTAGDGLIIAGIMTEFVRGGPLSHQLRCGAALWQAGQRT